MWHEMIIDGGLERADLRTEDNSKMQIVRLPPNSIQVGYYWDGKDKMVSLSELISVYEDNVLRTHGKVIGTLSAGAAAKLSG